MRRYLKKKIEGVFDDGPTLSQFATVDAQGRPWVRFVMSSLDDSLTARFPTKRGSRKLDHLARSPFAHLLVGKNLFTRNAEYLQICGRATVVDDPRTRRECWSPISGRFFTDADDPSYVVVELRPYRIEYWSALAAEGENPATLDEDDFAYVDDDFGEFWLSSEARTASERDAPSDPERNRPDFAVRPI